MTAISTKQELGSGQRTASAQFRGGLYTLMSLRIADPRDQAFFSSVMEKIAQAPDFFRHAPVVLDLQDLSGAPPFNMAELVRRLRQHQIVPIGVTNGTEEQNRAAVNTGLSIMPEGREAPVRDRTVHESAQPQAEVPQQTSSDEVRTAYDDRQQEDGSRDGEDAYDGGTQTKMVTRPVRSGKQVYGQNGDLVVMASISPGAELLADGHIHVYGALRGRAHAGVRGDHSARIFCRSLEAELISVAGHWRVREDIPEELIGKPVQMFLDGDQLVIEGLT